MSGLASDFLEGSPGQAECEREKERKNKQLISEVEIYGQLLSFHIVPILVISIPTAFAQIDVELKSLLNSLSGKCVA